MQERILGTRDGGLKVSAIGLGCMGITYGHGDAMDYASAEKLLQSAVEMGITLFDSAECYDGNEVVVGKALKPYRNQVAIVTKCGIRHGVPAARYWMPGLRQFFHLSISHFRN